MKFKSLLESIDKDTEIASYLSAVFDDEMKGIINDDRMPMSDKDLLSAFVKAMTYHPDDMMGELKRTFGIDSKDSKDSKENASVQKIEKALKSVCDKFFKALKSRTEDRERFKGWFSKPDAFERGIGMIIFSLRILGQASVSPIRKKILLTSPRIVRIAMSEHDHRVLFRIHGQHVLEVPVDAFQRDLSGSALALSHEQIRDFLELANALETIGEPVRF